MMSLTNVVSIVVMYKRKSKFGLIGSCPPNKPPIYCVINPCEHQNCSNIPNAQCVLDNCGRCKAKFINNGTDVTTQCCKCCMICKKAWSYHSL